MITKYTRPNRKGWTCLDWIVTNTDFVREAGTLDIFISDHLPVYCFRKKSRENNNYVYRMVRDYSKYDQNVFTRLIRSQDWKLFDDMVDVEGMWNFLYNKIYDILTVHLRNSDRERR